MLEAVLVGGIALGGLAASNVLYDRGVPHYLARKAAHAVAGLALLLMAVLFTSWEAPLALTLGFAALLLAARVLRPSTFRGVGGTGRPHTLAEINFPLGCAIGIAVGWAWLQDPWLGVLPGLFLAFGDSATGVVRSWHCKREYKGWCGTLAMLVVCLGLALLVYPYWAGVAMAVVATAIEKLTVANRYFDDNLTLPAGSAAAGAAASML